VVGLVALISKLQGDPAIAISALMFLADPTDSCALLLLFWTGFEPLDCIVIIASGKFSKFQKQFQGVFLP